MTSTWTTVCPLSAVRPESGVAALFGGEQVALFRAFDGRLFALSNVDPFSGAAVLARGIVGDRGGLPTVCSPMHKQVFSLETGACLDVPEVAVRTYPVRAHGGIVQVRLP